MTWHETLRWFGIGVPLSVLALVALDRLATPSARRSFVPVTAVRVRRRRLARLVAFLHHAPERAPTTTVAPQDERLVAPADVPAASPATRPSNAAAVPGVTPTRSRRLVAVLEASTRPPRPVQHPWAPGDSVRQPLVTGAAPGEATVRKRVWSAYATIAPAEVYGGENVERLERGRPPRRYNPLAGGVELMHVTVDAVGHARIAWADSGTACDPFAEAS